MSLTTLLPLLQLIFLPVTVVLLVIDWRQTLFIADNPESYREINLVLGPHPSRNGVHLYFGCCIALVMFIGCTVDHWAVLGALVATSLIEAWCITLNRSNHISF